MGRRGRKSGSLPKRHQTDAPGGNERLRDLWSEERPYRGAVAFLDVFVAFFVWGLSWFSVGESDTVILSQKEPIAKPTV